MRTRLAALFLTAMGLGALAQGVLDLGALSLPVMALRPQGALREASTPRPLSLSLPFQSGHQQTAEPPSLSASRPAAAAASCATGCAIGSHAPPPLTESEFRDLLRRFASEKISASNGGESSALDTLLFHGERSRELLARLGADGLDQQRLRFLRRELSRTQARLSVRIVDGEGVQRVRLGPVTMPLGIKQHLHADVCRRMQPPEISGTVYRVGLDHLWARL